MPGSPPDREDAMLRPGEAERFLAILGIDPKTPGIDALTELVRAHLLRIPFENISKLYRWRRQGLAGLVHLSEYLDGIEQHQFGGTCYTINFHLHELLVALGYDVLLCGADMRRPDVHLVNIVRVAGREFLVDAGYAAPFLIPMPLDLTTDHVVSLGRDRYVLSPRDAQGRSRLSLLRDGIKRHGYLVKPASRTIDEFAVVIADSFRPGATFLNSVLLARFGDAYSLVLHNLTSIETRGDTVALSTFPSIAELIEAIEREFGITASVSQVALDGLSMDTDAWG
jgi:N-hydroxyarylamine O-acetyltransferase